MRQSNFVRRAVTASLTVGLPLISLVAIGQKKSDNPNPVQLAQFETKVRPLLLASCVNCHGKANVQGGLRLDIAVSFDKAQEVLRRVKAQGGKPRMPIGSTLPAEKIASLEEWLQNGAPWPKGATVAAASLMEKGKSHWSFQPIRRPVAPTMKTNGWIQNPIDAFVLSRLEKKGLHPSGAASRSELIRRLSYDLTGLPPTPEEVAIFQSDRSPKAYESLVDRLLASPHYGEKWARHWLDLVRFAETNSYERDNPKPYAFKYRDYVIRAFNQDKPYDQFVREQIAGDEMLDATGDAVLATGYYRLGIWDDEPADKLQAQYDDLDDLIATTGQAFLGLTMDCARCHDHKLDPIPQKDYYRLLACFQNINRFKNGGPTDEARYFANSDAKREYDRKLAELTERRKANLAVIGDIEKRLISKGTQCYNLNDIVEMSYRYYERDWKRIPDFENEPVIASGTLKPGLISISPRQRNEEFAINYDGQLVVPKDGEYTFKFLAEGGYRFTVGGEKLFESFASSGKPVEMTSKKHLKAGKVSLNLVYNQRHNHHGLSISWIGPGFTTRPLSSLESCCSGGLATLFGSELSKILDVETASNLSKVVENEAALEKQMPPTEKVLCVTEAGRTAPKTCVLLRGVPTAQGDAVGPGFPICAGGSEVVIPEPTANAKSTGRRTALADWLTSPKNPLTARVIVNRIWQHHFGRGIVKSPNDFGLQGIRPTHPELLDYLSSEFVKNGWSFKNLHKLILTSNTYKQSSKGNTKALAADPQNDLFWRFDMRRLTAEELRDSLLAVAGNINLDMFGPSVYPEIPKEILAAQSRPGKDWFTERMTPEDVCRRSIYVNVKRSLIYPFFATFDLPETDRTASMRFASTQPTQALGMINGAFAQSQAEKLAARVRKEVGENPKLFVRRLLSLVLQRTPSETDVYESCALMDRVIKRGAVASVAQKFVCLMALNLDEFFYLD